jgi:hypothetical protein
MVRDIPQNSIIILSTGIVPTVYILSLPLALSIHNKQQKARRDEKTNTEEDDKTKRGRTVSDDTDGG